MGNNPVTPQSTKPCALSGSSSGAFRSSFARVGGEPHEATLLYSDLARAVHFVVPLLEWCCFRKERYYCTVPRCAMSTRLITVHYTVQLVLPSKDLDRKFPLTLRRRCASCLKPVSGTECARIHEAGPCTVWLLPPDTAAC